jgi:NAD(P)-dependent dehydrogenase (short-subunit alcohol dehydrogenase family)
MLISKTNISHDALKGEVAIVTGAGRGIGYEAARALLWLGANVVVAEVDEKRGKEAEEKMEQEFGKEKVQFVKTDVGSEKNIEKLAKEVTKRWGRADIVLNNATVFSMGAVKDVAIEKWDLSYQVNLRGPVLLARAFLPDMLKRKHGVIVCVSSSGAVPYMGAYEVFKTAQVELGTTLAAEVEDTGVYAFTIGPGISKTPGFIEGGGKVAALMGISLDELFDMNKNVQISPEAAGVGFAASVVLAKKYHGQEISSIQVLREIGIALNEETEGQSEAKEPLVKQEKAHGVSEGKSAADIYSSVLKTYLEQSEGWKKRNMFERQWISRDFKKNTGMSIDEMTDALRVLGEELNKQRSTAGSLENLKLLAGYYEHQQEQLRGFEKNPNKLKENLVIIDDWISDIKSLLNAMH